MIEIKGDFSSARIYADELESGSRGLIMALVNSPASKGSEIAIMPDVHPGKGCVIGTAMKVYPNGHLPVGLVGNDIGCGITAIQIKKPKRGFEFASIDKVVKETVEYKGSSLHIGGGNHFIEIDKDSDENYWMVVHTGSGCMGALAAKKYQDEAYENSNKFHYEFAYFDTPIQIELCVAEFDKITKYASERRIGMLQTILKKCKIDYTDTIIDVPHNYIEKRKGINEPDHYIIHKGSINAEILKPVLIPMNMKDGIAFGYGKGNPFWLNSAPHGAGRLYKRSDVKDHFTTSAFKKEMKEAGVYSSTVSSDTLDECPGAYKSTEDIINLMKPTVIVTDIWKPVYNYKGGPNK